MPSLDTAPLFALLTDFGQADAYVAAMQAVIWQKIPGARFLHISHAVGAGDIGHGAELLADIQAYLPRGTICVAVVDPGVGSDRAAVVVVTQDGRRFVGPDNGLLWPALGGVDFVAHRIENPAYLPERIAATFHGRDVFAQAAAHLAAGVLPERLGAGLTTLVPWSLPRAVLRDGAVHGEILRADHFGNLITSLVEADLPEQYAARELRVQCLGQEIHGLVSSYAQVNAGALLATWGGFGRLEIAVNGGSAATLLAFQPGLSQPVSVFFNK